LALDLDLIANSAEVGAIAENDDEAEERSVHQAYAQDDAADENSGSSIEDASDAYYAPSTIPNSSSDATIGQPSFQRSSRVLDFGAAVEDHRLSVVSTRTDYDLIDEAMNLPRPSRASVLAFLESNGEALRGSDAGSDVDSYSLSRFMTSVLST
jgi:hypothetical protein